MLPEPNTLRNEWICRKGHSNPHTESTCKECEKRSYNFNNEIAVNNLIKKV